MLLIPNCCAVAGFWSVLSFATLSLPLNSAEIWSITGATILQGPHQGAQQSKRTGTGESRTSCLKVASVTSTGFAGSSGVPHLPHFGLNPVFDLGTLFFTLQEGHLIISKSWLFIANSLLYILRLACAAVNMVVIKIGTWDVL